MADKKTLYPKVKSLFKKALFEAESDIEKSQLIYDNIIKSPDKSDGRKLLDSVIELALAKAKLETLQEAYINEGGDKFPTW